MKRFFTNGKLAVLLIFTVIMPFSLASGKDKIAPGQVVEEPFGYDEIWSFGVMADTQWTPYGFRDDDGVKTYGLLDPEGENKGSVAIGIIDQLNQRFIAHGVKFVIAVGDLTDNGSDAGIAARAAAAQALYNAGIGFFPMRGNHEMYHKFFSPTEPDNGYGVPAMKANFPQNTGAGNNLFGARNFSSPEPADETMRTDLYGMSYSFEYGPEGGDATFVIIDDWATEHERTEVAGLTGVYYGYTLEEQLPWIRSKLELYQRPTTHGFIFSHQPMIAENHTDSIFGGYLKDNKSLQNEFIGLLDRNKVAFYISGHDHQYCRSIIESPDTLSNVEQIICQSDCPKMYGPYGDSYVYWYGEKTRSTQIAQEFRNIGYYIFTVNGPNVTVDYYSDATGEFDDNADFPYKGALENEVTETPYTPTFNFVKKDTFHFSLMGDSYLVEQGGTYADLRSRYSGTEVKLLAGANNSTATTMISPTGSAYNLTADAPLVKKVNFAWEPKTDGVYSNILIISGIAEFGADSTPADPKTTDKYVIRLATDDSLAYTPSETDYIILSMDTSGEWVNAASLTGATPNYVGVIDLDANPAFDFNTLNLGDYGFYSQTRYGSSYIYPIVKVNYEGKFAVAKKTSAK